MLDNFKYYLEGVKTSQFNVREQTFIRRLLSFPIDPAEIGKLPIFFKDYWHKFTDVLMSGHEFLLLINIINFINIFYIATSSVVVACVITMVICRLVIKNLADFFIKRNISRNSLIDEKFFSWSHIICHYVINMYWTNVYINQSATTCFFTLLHVTLHDVSYLTAYTDISNLSVTIIYFRITFFIILIQLLSWRTWLHRFRLIYV